MRCTDCGLFFSSRSGLKRHKELLCSAVLSVLKDDQHNMATIHQGDQPSNTLSTDETVESEVMYTSL